MVICLERGADLHIAQLMPLPLTVSCFSKIQIGFAFLVPAHLGGPGERAVKRVCACACARVCAQEANVDAGSGQRGAADADTRAPAADDCRAGERVPAGEPAVAAETAQRRRAGTTARGQARRDTAAHSGRTPPR